jgi:DNA sulfur modification protein DndE
MNWKIFAGEYADVYLALLIQRAHEEARPVSREVLSELLIVRIHIARGIGFLTVRRQLNGINDLLEIAS